MSEGEGKLTRKSGGGLGDAVGGFINAVTTLSLFREDFDKTRPGKMAAVQARFEEVRERYRFMLKDFR